MQEKQHTNFKYRLLAVLFLFFNIVCAATPVIKLTDDYPDAVSVRLVQIGNPLENEEENHASPSWHVNQFNHISVRKLCDIRVCDAALNKCLFSLPVSADKSSDKYIPDDSILPVPGNYAFLFRYTLF